MHNHLSAEKKILLKELRSEEDLRALLFCRVSSERHRRRVRDFSIRALETQRLGMKKEKELQARRQAEEQRRQELSNQKKKKGKMLNDAMNLDSKWKAEETNAMLKKKTENYEYSQLKYHAPYTMENPFQPVSYALNSIEHIIAFFFFFALPLFHFF